MFPFLQNLLATLAGLLTGALVNSGLVALGGIIIPAPEGGDIGSTEALAATMHLFGPQHFIFPFLAHALGTLVGAWAACRLASAGSREPSWITGSAFLAGGAYMVALLPAPLWFEAADLTLAYLPMAWLGQRLGSKGGLV